MTTDHQKTTNEPIIIKLNGDAEVEVLIRNGFAAGKFVRPDDVFIDSLSDVRLIVLPHSDVTLAPVEHAVNFSIVFAVPLTERFAPDFAGPILRLSEASSANLVHGTGELLSTMLADWLASVDVDAAFVEIRKAAERELCHAQNSVKTDIAALNHMTAPLIGRYGPEKAGDRLKSEFGTVWSAMASARDAARPLIERTRDLGFAGYAVNGQN